MIYSSNTHIPLGAGGIPLPFFGLTATTLDAIDQIPVEKVVATNQQYIESPPPPRPFDLGNYTIEKIVDNDVKQFVDVNNVTPTTTTPTTTTTTTTPKNNNSLFLLLGGVALLFILKNKK